MVKFFLGGNISDLGSIDGVNQWDTITTGGSHSSRHEVLHNIDDITGYAAIRVGNLKYVNGKGAKICYS